VTLTSLLEIKIGMLSFEDQRALYMAEEIWLASGSPSEPRALCVALEEVLSALNRAGVYYPKVLLLRKKQLERGTWTPRRTKTPPTASTNSTVAASCNPAQGGLCPDCRGTGLVMLPGGKHATFCSRCDSRKRPHEAA
jgi:hypothetical protein